AAHADLATASAAIEDLERRIAVISVDADILARGEDIENLAQKRPIIEKQQEVDSPRWEAEREELLVRVADLMARAELDGGPEDLDGMLPSALKRKAIQSLADAGKKLMAQRSTLQDSAEIAVRALSKAQDRAAQTARPRQVGELSRALTAADKLGDITADIAKRTRALERKTKVLNETIAGLGLGSVLPIDGSSPLPGRAGVPAEDVPGADRVTMLRELAIPPEKTEARYADWLAGLDQKIKDDRDAFELLDAELAEIDARIVAMKTAGDVATEDDLKAA